MFGVVPDRSSNHSAHEGTRGAPDRFSDEVTVAWRNWKVDTKILEKGHIWLYSLFNKDCFWFGCEPLKAYCKYEKKISREDHQSPRNGCECGIYAYKDMLPVLNYSRTTLRQENVILGQVSLWGRIREHENGWKAEWAYPYSFIVPQFDNDSHHEISQALSKQFIVDTEIWKIKKKERQ